MPRQARMDFPGALNHIMVRGIERCSIFADDTDRISFLRRLESAIVGTDTVCFAFALMDNHVHLLLQTTATPISRVMQSLLTGYAMEYNFRHKRSGKLYQNRFKSILCDKDTYFLQLIRYIHLNPLRANAVEDLQTLETYPWTSHAALIGKQELEWLNTEEVLSHFGTSVGKARESYQKYIQDAPDAQELSNLRGGGLIRSLGGIWEIMKKKRGKEGSASDERILGGSEFVEAALKNAEHLERLASKRKRQGWNAPRVKRLAARTVGVEVADLNRHSRDNARARGRALFCKWMVEDLGMSQADVARDLEITRQAVGFLVDRGRSVERKMKLCFDKALRP